MINFFKELIEIVLSAKNKISWKAVRSFPVPDFNYLETDSAYIL
jgi:hypothetical protein